MTIQERILELMAERGWSEYRLAKEAGLSQSTVTKIFDRNNAPTHPTVEAICAAFGMTLSQFYADEGEPVVLTPRQQKHLRLWRMLSNTQQDLLDSFLEDIIDK